MSGYYEMRQPIFTPEIKDCWCGEKARVIDWNFDGQYQVMCDKNHILTGKYIYVNRAVCKWNNALEKNNEQ